MKQSCLLFPAVRKICQCGQSITEMALVLPILLLIGALAIDLANLVLTAHRIAAAVHEGARYATESSLPVPETFDNCSINAGQPDECATTDNGTCCIAASRAFRVLFDSGITDGSVRATWLTRKIRSADYAFLRVQASATVNFFFNIASQTITSSATAFVDCFRNCNGTPARRRR